MDRHSVTKAPQAGGADRRQDHLLVKILGTLAVAAFMISVSAGTAQALGIGEVVEVLPVEVDLGTGPAPESQPEPEQPTAPEQPAQGSTGLGEVVEEMTEVTTEPVSDQPGPTQQPAPQNPVNTIVEPVGRVVSPVAEVIEEPVGGQATRPAIEAVEPVTDTVEKVVDSASGTIDKPVNGVLQTVSPILEEIDEPLKPVLGAVTTSVERTTEVVEDVSAAVRDGVDELAAVAVPLVPSPADLLGGVDEVIGGIPDFDADPAVPGLSSPDPERAISGPDQEPSPSMTNPPREPLASPLPAPIAANAETVDNVSYSEVPALPTAPPALRNASGQGLALSGAEPSPRDSEGSGLPSRAPVVAASSSSISGSFSGLLAVLVLLGLIAPRLSRWLRPRPVLWRPFALAEALALPG